MMYLLCQMNLLRSDRHIHHLRCFLFFAECIGDGLAECPVCRRVEGPGLYVVTRLSILLESHEGRCADILVFHVSVLRFYDLYRWSQVRVHYSLLVCHFQLVPRCLVCASCRFSSAILYIHLSESYAPARYLLILDYVEWTFVKLRPRLV